MFHILDLTNGIRHLETLQKAVSVRKLRTTFYKILEEYIQHTYFKYF